MTTERLTTAHLIEPKAEGEVIGYRSWPDHLTVVPPVNGELTPKFIHAIGEVVAATPAFEATATAEDFFGPNKDIHVQRFEVPDHIRELRATMVDIMRAHDLVIPDKYEYHNFNPHLTLPRGLEVNPWKEGDKLAIPVISFVTSLDGINRVLKNLQLSSTR